MRIGELTRGQQVRLAGAALFAQAGASPQLFRRPSRRTSATDRPTPPDSKLCRESLDHAESSLAPTIFAHSLRRWEFGVALAEIDGVRFDPETFYVASVLHDIALGGPDDAHRGCFAAIGAQTARSFVLQREATLPMAEHVHDAIALHMDVATPKDAGPEAALLHGAAHLDVVGTRAHELDPNLVRSVHTDLPRDGFDSEFSSAMRMETGVRPNSRAATLWRAGMPVAMALNPLRRQRIYTEPIVRSPGSR